MRTTQRTRFEHVMTRSRGDSGSMFATGKRTFQHRKLSAQQLKSRLFDQNVNVSISSGSGMKLSYEARNLDPLLRASVHYYNTTDEVEKFVSIIKSL